MLQAWARSSRSTAPADSPRIAATPTQTRAAVVSRADG